MPCPGVFFCMRKALGCSLTPLLKLSHPHHKDFNKLTDGEREREKRSFKQHRTMTDTKDLKVLCVCVFVFIYSVSNVLMSDDE